MSNSTKQYDPSHVSEYMAQFQQEDTEGGHFRSFSHQWEGPTAIAEAVRMVVEQGESQKFIVADPARHGYKTYGWLKLWREGKTIRFSDSHFSGESKLSDLDPVDCAVNLTLALSHLKNSYTVPKDAHFFRQPPEK